MAQTDEKDDLDWVVSVDSTSVRAHQDAAGPAKQGRRQASRPAIIGRSGPDGHPRPDAARTSTGCGEAAEAGARPH
jgi:hypothetical protein